MQYNDYEKKIKRIAGFLAKLYANLTLIIICASVLTVATTALVATKGLILSEGECPTELVYGQVPSYEASAFLADVSYEYSVEGKDEWTSELPTEVGKYQSRTVALSSFGNPRYGEVQPFEIKPKPITLTVASTSVVYGDNPTITAELEYGDVLECGAVFSDISAAQTSVCADVNTLKITDADGNDRKSNYDITAAPMANVSINPRPVTVIVDSASKVYDNTVLECRGWETPELPYNDFLVATSEENVSIIDVGTVENVLTFSVYANGGKDMSHKYIISVKPGELEVTKKIIEISTESSEKVYNDELLENRNYNFDNAADYEFLNAQGHRAEVKSSSAIIECGSVENAFEFAIYNASGDDITNNYNFIHTSKGTLTVTPRPITFKAQDAEIEYNAQSRDFTSTKVIAHADYPLLAGHDNHYEAVNAPKFENAGTYENIYDMRIRTDDGRDVTANYDITFIPGTVVINAKPIDVVATVSEWIYNGQIPTFGNQKEYTVLGLVTSRHTVSLSYTVDGADVGTYDIKYNSEATKIYDASGIDISENYDINYVEAELDIIHRKLTLTSQDGNWVYDGDEHKNEKYEIGGADGLALGHKVAASVIGAITNAGDEKNIFDESATKITDADGNDVTENYEITYVTGTLGISRKQIIITAASGEWEYDGKAHSDKGFTIDELVSGHKASVTVNGQITYVSESPVSNRIVRGSVVIMNGEEDVTQNYSVKEYIDGTLTIIPRKITLTAGSGRWEFDGETHVNPDLPNVTSGSIVEGETLIRCNVDGSIKYVGTCDNVPSDAAIYSANGKDVTANYEITYENGTLEVYRRRVTLQALDAERPYIGQNHIIVYNAYMSQSNEVYRIVGEKTLADGHVIATISSTGKDCNGELGDYALSIMNETLVVREQYGNGDDITENYEFVFEDATLTIVKRKLYVTAVPMTSANDTAFVYDGTSPMHENYRLTTGADVQVKGDNVLTELGHVLGILNEIDGGYTDVGVYNSKLASWSVLDASGKDVSGYYEIVEYIPANIEIVPRPITVTSGSVDTVYDGDEHFNDKYEIGGYGLVGGHTATVPINGAYTDADTYDNIIDKAGTHIYDANGVDVTHNYAIEFYYGTIVIRKRQITITAGSLNVEYDGKDHPCYDYALDGDGLIEGDTIDVIFDGNVYRDAGEYPNVIVGFELNNRGNILTDNNGNYSVSLLPGKITINRRNITLSTESGEWVYDGTEHKQEQGLLEESRLAEGHTYVIGGYAGITDAGSKDNTVSVTILDENRNPVTDNYNISEELGTLTVTPKKVVITAKAWDDLVYGGRRPDTKYSQNADFYMYATVDSLVEGHMLRGLGLRPADCTWGDVGTYGIEFTGTSSFSISDASGNTVLRSNYEFEFVTEGATLTILPAPITLHAIVKTHVYDGTTPKYAYCTFEEEYPFLSGAEINVVITTDNPNVGQWVGIVDEEQTEIILSGRDVTHNFVFDYSTNRSDIEIIPRQILVTVGNDTWVYDGVEHTVPVNKVDVSATCENIEGAPALVTNHTWLGWDQMEFSLSLPIMSVGTYGGYIKVNLPVRIVDADGNNVSENYRVSYEYGDVTVTKRTLTVTAQNGEWVYDGTYHSENGWTVEGLCGRDEVNAVISSEIRDVVRNSDGSVGTLPNVININDVTVTRDGGSVLYNYDIKTVSGTLKVTPLYITVSSGSGSFEYDGTAHSVIDHDMTDGKLLDGHSISFIDYAAYIDVTGEDGEYNSAQAVIEDENGDDVSRNYEITELFGKITVTKRKITITSPDHFHAYDGNKPTINNKHGEIINIVAGHTAKTVISALDCDGSIGEYTGRFIENNTLIFDENDKDVTANYEISYGSFKVIITPPEITVIPKDVTYIYDGTVHTFDELIIEDGDNTITAKAPLEAVGYSGNAGKYVLRIGSVSDVRVYNANGKDITDNYTIIIGGEGSLTVERKALKITSASDSWVYDGKNHYNHTYTYDGLVNGHILNAVLNRVIYRVEGGVENAFDKSQTTVTDAYGNNVTENYDITHYSGTIEITPMPIRITTYDAQTVYNGQKFGNNEYTLDESTLLDGYEYIINLVEVVKAGTHTNRVDTARTVIRDAEGNDATSNFTFEGTYGTITVDKRPIKVVTGSAEFVYDGGEHTWERAEFVVKGEYEPIDGHYLRISNAPSFVTVSDSGPNKLAVKIYDASNVEVTSNYDIEYEYGTVTITPCTLYLTPVKTVSDTSETVHIPKQIIQSNEITSMLEYNGVVITPTVYIVEEVTGEGIYTSRISSVVLTQNGQIVSEDNYELVLNDGIYEVKDKVIYIMLMKQVKEYDGVEIVYTSGQWIIQAPDGLTVEIGLNIRMIDYGRLTFTKLNENKEMYISWFTVKDADGNDISAEYTNDYFNFLSFNESDDVIVISKRKITVESPSDVHEYDGNAFSNNNVKVSQGSLANGHTLTATTSSFDAVGTYDNLITSITVTDASGADVTDNYDITKKYGDVTIKPAKNQGK